MCAEVTGGVHLAWRVTGAPYLRGCVFVLTVAAGDNDAVLQYLLECGSVDDVVSQVRASAPFPTVS